MLYGLKIGRSRESGRYQGVRSLFASRRVDFGKLRLRPLEFHVRLWSQSCDLTSLIRFSIYQLIFFILYWLCVDS